MRQFKTIKELKKLSVKELEHILDKALDRMFLFEEQKYLNYVTKIKRILNNKH